MNLCRIYPVFALACIVGGVLIAHFTGASLLHGAMFGLVAGVAPILLLGMVYALLMAWCPDRPPCRCGECRSADYEFIGPTNITPETELKYRCPSCS